MRCESGGASEADIANRHRTNRHRRGVCVDSGAGLAGWVLGGRMRKDTDFAALLRDWAQYMEKAESAGYSSVTTLWLAMAGQQHGEFGSKIPVGLAKLTTWGQLRDLLQAMATLESYPDEDVSMPVRAVQHYYRLGMEATREKLDRSKATVFTLIKTGEALIKREMNW